MYSIIYGIYILNKLIKAKVSLYCVLLLLVSIQYPDKCIPNYCIKAIVSVTVMSILLVCVQYHEKFKNKCKNFSFPLSFLSIERPGLVLSIFIFKSVGPCEIFLKVKFAENQFLAIICLSVHKKKQ